MTVWSPAQIMGIWLRNGGSVGGKVVMTAVALAESGGDDQAISPADDHGLWQINRINFRAFGLNDTNVLDPDVNARVAISMSGNGTNVAAWCTCWVNPGRDCGHGFISTPQVGSPAWDELPRAQAVSGVGATIGATSNLHTGVDSVHLAWNDLNGMVSGFAQSRWKDLHVTATQVGRLRL